MKRLSSGMVVVILMFTFYQSASADVLTVPDGGTGNSFLDFGYFLLGNGSDPVIASSSPSLFGTLFNNFISAFSSDGQILLNNNGVLAASSSLSFEYRTNPGSEFAVPTLHIGPDDILGLNIFAYPDSGAVIQPHQALSGNGGGLSLGAGNGAENGDGGPLWLVSGAGSGSGANGPINIYANNGGNPENGGNILAQTTRSQLWVVPGGMHMFANDPEGEDSGSVDFTVGGGGLSLTSTKGLTMVNPGTGAISNGQNYLIQAINYTGLDSPAGMLIGTGNNSYGFVDILGGGAIWQLSNRASDGGTFNIAYNNNSSSNTYSDSMFRIATSGDVTIPNNFAVNKHIIFGGSTPTVSSGSSDCGTAPSIVGTDNAGRITSGTGPNGNKCTVTFAHAWGNPPICLADKETNNSAVRATNVTTTNFQIVGQIGPSQSLVYHCVGY